LLKIRYSENSESEDEKLQDHYQHTKINYAKLDREYRQQKKSSPTVKPPQRKIRDTEPTEEDSKFDMGFLDKTDYNDTQRDEYYEGLKVNMTALDKRMRGTLINGKKGINVTMIAEKPSIAKIIADALSNGKSKENMVCF
jgi:hypothetical protein